MAKKTKKVKKVATPVVCNHKTAIDLSLKQWHEKAIELVKKDIMQSQCPICKKWLFPFEL